MKAPEKAVYITSAKGLGEIPQGFSRVYFGCEFCQWRLPAPSAASGAWTKVAGMGLGFTLVTPWVTDAGLKRLRSVFTALRAAGAGGVEVVVNDFGVLKLLGDEFPGFVPVFGRLLVKQKRCPRVPGIMARLPEAGRGVYLGSNVDDPVTARFIRRLGVGRVELDNPLQGFDADLKANRLKGSLYTPYAYVTTTRYCPASFDGKAWGSLTGCGARGCLRSVIRLTDPAHGADMLMRGNTMFVEGAPLPAGLAEMGIDRIVHMPEVP